MNFVKKILTACGYLIGGFFVLHLFSSEAWTAETESGWRSSYDLIMMWLNFAILAFVLIKFGRNPIKAFFREQKENLSRTIGNIEAQKEANAAKIQQNQKLLQDSSVRFNEIKEKIIAQGERQKEAIIESARWESKLLVDNANLWINRQILLAKQRLKFELIDEAIEQALQRLPQALTPEDKRKYINHYVAEIDILTKEKPGLGGSGFNVAG